jgi:hypothetical protein
VERLGINPTLPVEQILDQLATLDPIQFQDLGYMFEEFVRAPMPFKVLLSCTIDNKNVLQLAAGQTDKTLTKCHRVKDSTTVYD